jgi:hypothetical protein
MKCKPALGLAFCPLIGHLLVPTPSLAAMQRLECILTNADGQAEEERRSIAVIFNDENNSMRLEQAGHVFTLTDVSISMTSMSGGGAEMTVAVSRSSLRVVLQTYQGDSVRNEYGDCTAGVRKKSSSVPPGR